MTGKDLVKSDEILAIVQDIHGPKCKLLDFKAEKGTTSVQGFLSNILRIVARVEIDGATKLTNIIAKTLPSLQSQLEMTEEIGVFEKEIGFFEHCAPLLWQVCPDLPIVRCYRTNKEDQIIYMEDLKQLGFKAIVQSVPDLKDDLLTMEHIALAVSTVAKFHSASAGINWLEKFPHLFEVDTIFERNDGAIFRKMIKQSVEMNLIPIAETHFKELLPSVKWVGSEEFFQSAIALCKESSQGLNILCHGDSWANNMMFKLDPKSGKPLDVKLIDFQICRFAPGSRDLLYFLHACTSFQFRQKHEDEILRIYVKAFNENCSKLGKDISLDFDKFKDEYSKSRLFGVLMSVVMRPVVYLEGMFPSGEEELGEDQFRNLFEGGSDANAALLEYEKNAAFREEIFNVLHELHSVWHKYML